MSKDQFTSVMEISSHLASNCYGVAVWPHSDQRDVQKLCWENFLLKLQEKSLPTTFLIAWNTNMVFEAMEATLWQEEGGDDKTIRETVWVLGNMAAWLNKYSDCLILELLLNK